MQEKHGQERAESPPSKRSKLFRVLVLGGAVLVGCAAVARAPSAPPPQSADDGGTDGGGAPGW
jgi:hypothetical protein